LQPCACSARRLARFGTPRGEQTLPEPPRPPERMFSTFATGSNSIRLNPTRATAGAPISVQRAVRRQVKHASWGPPTVGNTGTSGEETLRCRPRQGSATLAAVALARPLHRYDAAGRIGSGPPDRATSNGERWEKGMGAMSRVLGIAKMIGSLLAIEVFVPGGTLIVLTLLLTSRTGSPLRQRIVRRFPTASRLLSGLAGSAWPATSAASQS